MLAGKGQLPSGGRDANSTERVDGTNGNTKGARGLETQSFLAKDVEISPEGKVRHPPLEGVQRRGTAYLAEGTNKQDKHRETTSMTNDFQHENTSPAIESASGTNDSETSRQVYQPRPQEKFSTAEFASSAVMVKNSAGEPESVKLYYDTMSTGNIASQKFVDKYGYRKRPILLDDLAVYDTVTKDVFAPTHYVEIELRDRDRGINDFVKASFNVAESMDGLGLLVGHKFMSEHGIELSAKEGRGAFVVKGRKPSEEAKKAQKQLLAQAAKAKKQAEGYAASSAGSTTTGTGPTQQENAATESSHTSISTGSKTVLKE